MKITIIAISILALFALYCVYQIVRDEAVYNIRHNWIYSEDKRWYKYTYNYMHDPSKHNWFGLRFPKDSHFK